MNLITTHTNPEIPRLTPHERAGWAVARTQGKNRFLLLPGLPIALAVAAAAAIERLARFGFTLDTLTSFDFLLEVGITFHGVYAVSCFVQLLRWQKNEYLFSLNEGDEESPRAAAVK
ncbi:MAG TPA: hypothetical protein VN256_06775 [Pyrinomonadaceae bacterium]|nr:hypothetical protein [Pyrinomonadaceae bacterium]